MVDMPQAQAMPDASVPLQDPILRQAEQKIESGLTPINRKNYMRVVAAGMKVALEGGPNSIMYQLKYSKDPIHDCAKGAVNLVFLMRKQSRGTMPMKAMVPAGMTLLIKALDFAEKAGIISQVTPQVLVKATHIFTDEIFKAYGITPQMLQTAAVKLHPMINDPATLDKMKVNVGMLPVPPAQAAIPAQAGMQAGMINKGM